MRAITTAAVEPDKAITVLSVSADQRQHTDLRSLFEHSNWILLEADSCCDGLAVLRRHAIPVVICDANLPDGTWTDLLRRGQDAPAVIVAEYYANDQSWTSVLTDGGYDLVEKPFQRTDLFRSIGYAWRNWKDRCRAPLVMSATG